MSFVAKKKEEECELHGAGGVVHRQVLGWVAISGKKSPAQDHLSTTGKVLSHLLLLVFQVASEVVGGLVPFLRASNLASRSSIRTFSMTEICADFLPTYY